MQGRKPLGLEFSEKLKGNVNSLTHACSSPRVLVVEKVGSLGEMCMDHTSTISCGDEVVAVGGAGGQLKYFKTNTGHGNISLRSSLSEAINEVTEPVRLQLERHFDPVEVRHLFT